MKHIPSGKGIADVNATVNEEILLIVEVSFEFLLLRPSNKSYGNSKNCNLP